MSAGYVNPGGAQALGELLPGLLAGRELTREAAEQVLNAMLAPETPDVQIAAALALLASKGEGPEVLAGFADSLYERVVPVAISSQVLDTAGTGASPVKTFNISTAAAFVIAAAGCQIAKHGARASTSRSGSADVLAALGARIDCSPATAERSFRELGICFLFAPLYHPALARVAGVRRSLGFRTTFNLVGPLVNPCRAQYRLLGVSDEARMAVVAGALDLLGIAHAWVLRGDDGLDEITTAAPTRVLEVREGLDRHSAAGGDLRGRVLRARQRARDDAIEMHRTQGRRDHLRLLAATHREGAVGLAGEHRGRVRAALAMPDQIERRCVAQTPSSAARSVHVATRVIFGCARSRFQEWSNSQTLIPASASERAMSTSSSQNASSSSSFASRTL